jgi:hypothetical protein
MSFSLKSVDEYESEELSNMNEDIHSSEDYSSLIQKPQARK